MDKKLLRTLCELDGISGREEAVRTYILKELETISVPHETSVDAMGNVLVNLHGKQPAGHRLLLDAHMDEVGFLVSHITPEGYLRFQTVGGIDKQVLFGRRVRIGAQPGVIGGKAIHHCSKKESEQIPAVEDMLIDIGAGSAEEAEKLVAIGAAGTFASAFVPHGENGFVGKAVDDRVGCALLLTLAKEQPARDVWLSFSVQEEVGLRGAGAAAYAVRPDVATAIWRRSCISPHRQRTALPAEITLAPSSAPAAAFAWRRSLCRAGIFIHRPVREAGRMWRLWSSCSVR